MTPYTPADAFSSAVNIYDITSPVLGGASGDSNNPIKQLADRTEYLKNRQGRYLGFKNLSANGSVLLADIYKLINVDASNNITVSLASVAVFPSGTIIPFKIKCAANKAVTVLPDGAEEIQDGNKTWTPLWACDGESFNLVAFDSDGDSVSDIWILEQQGKGNFDIAGNDGLFRIQPRNTAIANGTEVLRADFPRAWAALSAGAIDESLWNSDIRYKQFASSGNGTTTFRWPDMRAMMHKGLDMGRALSTTRLDNVSGGLELDANKEHFHETVFTNNANSSTGSGKLTVGGDAPEGVAPRYKSNGAIDGSGVSIGNSENLVKTAGFIPVIFY